MNNALARQFGTASLLRFALPNIIMMAFLSMYTIVDGMFIAQYAGTVALGSINITYPLACLEMAVGIMLATGGSAIIARRLGEGHEDMAQSNFTFLVLVSFIIGLLFTVVGILFLNPIIAALGASPAQFPFCQTYAFTQLAFAPAMMLQTAFQTLFVTAGKPGLGLASTIGGGLANMLLDYLFIAVFRWGIAGAALASGIGYLVPALTGLIYFAHKRKSPLYFIKPNADWRMLLYACGNGSSEMVTNIANAITTFLFNMLFLKFWGVDGVASISIVLYFQFVFTAVFFGFSLGVAPVISYKYGAKDTKQLKRIFKSCMGFVVFCSIASYALSRLVISTCLQAFTSPGSNVFNITMEGFPLYALSFLFMGVSIFASALFTAFSDGRVSAIISFARTLVFLVAMLLLLPALLGKVGIWLAVPAAELPGLLISLWFLVRKKTIYQY